MSEHFWDERWSEFTPFHLEPEAFRQSRGAAERVYLLAAGPSRGQSVLDLGCGNGEYSVYFARMGARVTAVDNSETGIRNTEALAAFNGVRVRALKLDAMNLAELGESYDLVVGRFILHHIEPFDAFARVLGDILADGGRALFLENNARNRLLVFFREHLTGRFGIPKYGDREEHPLQPAEISVLETRFREVVVSYPEFLFFRMMGAYLLKERPAWMRFFEKLDNAVFRCFPVLRPYGYLQVIEVRK